MFDPMKLYGSELQALAGEEALLAVALCQQAFGSDRLERSRQDLEATFRFLPNRLRDQVIESLESVPATATGQPDKAWERALGRVVDAFSGDLIGGEVDVDKLIGGVAALGHVGSCAYRLMAALEAGSTTYVVATDHRLIIAEWDYGNEKDARGLRPVVFRELVSVPRSAVIRARRRGTFLQRGRVVLDFVDLSQLALMTGMLSTRPARRLVGAIRPAGDRV